jgi:hypothetical protein
MSSEESSVPGTPLCLAPSDCGEPALDGATLLISSALRFMELNVRCLLVKVWCAVVCFGEDTFIWVRRAGRLSSSEESAWFTDAEDTRLASSESASPVGAAAKREQRGRTGILGI